MFSGCISFYYNKEYFDIGNMLCPRKGYSASTLLNTTTRTVHSFCKYDILDILWGKPQICVQQTNSYLQFSFSVKYLKAQSQIKSSYFGFRNQEVVYFI